MPTATPTPAASLLTPDDHVLILIDHQSQMAFATKSIDPAVLRNNTALIAKCAAGFKVSTLLTTVAEKSFSGPIFNEITEAFPNAQTIDRTTMNTWEDPRIAEQINSVGKGRLVERRRSNVAPLGDDVAPGKAALFEHRVERTRKRVGNRERLVAAFGFGQRVFCHAPDIARDAGCTSPPR